MGTFVLLGCRQRAPELLNFFLTDQRPPGCVASDSIRSALDLLAYEREAETVPAL